MCKQRVKTSKSTSNGKKYDIHALITKQLMLIIMVKALVRINSAYFVENETPTDAI